MKISHAYKVITEIMKLLEGINTADIYKKELYQKRINQAYNKLDKFRDEFIRESIKRKQRRSE